jgi:hypothetical protein
VIHPKGPLGGDWCTVTIECATRERTFLLRDVKGFSSLDDPVRLYDAWMRSVLRRVAVFGLLGVVTSYGVAWGMSTVTEWGCSNQGSASPTSNPAGTWRVSFYCCPSMDSALNMWESEPLKNAAMYEGAEKFILPWTGWTTFPENPDRLSSGRANESTVAGEEMIRFGWPCRCTQIRQRFDRSITDPPTDDVRLDTGWMGAVEIAIPWRPQPYLGDRGLFLPFRPLWPGLVLNTALYGSLLWTVLFGPGALRRTLRRRRGLCVRCGYGLRGGAPSAPCPECGGGR